MWILGKKIFDILIDEKITLDKKLEVFSKYKSKLPKEIEMLTDLQVINYLFRSKLPVEVKMFLCEEIEQLALKSGDSIRFKNIYNTFVRRYGSNEDILLLNYCPNCFKKIVVSNVYGINLLDAIRDRSVSIDKRKVIIDVKLSSNDAIKLLKEDLEDELIDFIIDSKIIFDKLIKDCIGYNSELSVEIKSKIIERKINFSNIFKITKLGSYETKDLVFKVKEKELEDYIVRLDSSNVLDVIISSSNEFSKRIIDVKENVVKDAVKTADLSILENCLYYGRDERLIEFITKYRRKDVLSILKNVDENRIIQFLKSSFLPLEYKDYIVENNKEKLVSKIKSLSIIQVSFFHLTDSSLLPLDVKEMMFLNKTVVDGNLKTKINDKIPASLEDTLNKAFIKAFELVFNNGTSIIEKSIDKEKINLEYETNKFRLDYKESKENIENVDKYPKKTNFVNNLLTIRIL